MSTREPVRLCASPARPLKQRLVGRLQSCFVNSPLSIIRVPGHIPFFFSSPTHHWPAACSIATTAHPPRFSGMADQLLSAAALHESLPKSYVRPEQQRPRLDEVMSDDNIPLIDLGCPDRSQIIREIAHACRYYGFFQVINHGVSKDSMQTMMSMAHEFFSLPLEEKARLYSDDPSKKTRLSTSFNVRKETVRNWRDYLRLHCYPLEEYVPQWPSKPALFK
ncbi:hypothetical protein Taro_039643 [Colocasia esculenta]|uniref:Non-haem dioxygenase N-terminal domain-containing protein n=1 Tax=Colocasia esculenta TaxID=4460 RepID=A0A843WGC9_COLES|nr:hypothetical protein [Colocasia esculenta]